MSENGYKPHSHVPYGADGSGFYTDNTLGCYNVVKRATPTLLKAIDQAPCDGESPFVFCDYGTADGGIGMFMMMEVIAALRKKYGEELPIQIVYEDQPINDFKSLFLRVHGLVDGAPTYMTATKNVFPLACGTSFYSQCLPSSNLNVGFSSTAMHWLSKLPCAISGALHMSRLSDEAEKRAWKAQAAADWEHIMLLRARELMHGGQMVIAGFCVDDQNQYLGRTNRLSKHDMFLSFTRIWGDFVKEGKITQAEFDNTNFINYYRTVKEYSAPFTDPNSPVYKAGLRLVSIETAVVSCPYQEKWMKDGKKGDAEAARKHAKWYVPTTRTWSNSTFLSGLSESRPEAERISLVDEMYARYEAEVAADPSQAGMDYVHAYLHIKKI